MVDEESIEARIILPHSGNGWNGSANDCIIVPGALILKGEILWKTILKKKIL